MFEWAVGPRLEEETVKIEFIASMAVVTPDPAASRALYVEALGLPLEGDDYPHSEQVAGSRHFGLWPLPQAARACFGTDEWPAGTPVPQASIEFELADADAVAAGARELDEAGYTLLHDGKLEPWGQTVARLLSPESLIVGLSYAPALH
jgi:catechol 2,3-dioxygenase-like lactoylglutathione lyase family enzyme